VEMTGQLNRPCQPEYEIEENKKRVNRQWIEKCGAQSGWIGLALTIIDTGYAQSRELTRRG
jgi:hypothetical protein